MRRGWFQDPVCRFCPLKGCVKVPPEGNPAARIAIVGMGPGWLEERDGQPFVGPSGQVLNRVLREVGLRREELWIDNAALCRPRAVELDPQRGLWIGKRAAEVESCKRCRDRLLADLKAVRPTVIVTMGALPLQMLTGLDALGATACAIMKPLPDVHPAHVIASYHPAHLLRGEQRLYPALVAALEKAKRLAQCAFRRPLGQLVVIDPTSPTIDTDIPWLEQRIDEILATGEDIAVDVETTNAEALEAVLTVVGVGVGSDSGQGIAVTVRVWNPSTGQYDFVWNEPQWRRVNAALARLLAGRNRKWYWNFGFDVTVLERHFKLGGEVADGMILHHLVQPDLPHGLSFAAHTLLDVAPWKYNFRSAEKAGTATHRDLLVYNAQDSLYTFRLAAVLQKLVADRGNAHLVKHQLRAADLARRAYVRGIPIDMSVWQSIYDEHDAKRRAALELMRASIAERSAAIDELNEYIDQRRRQRSKARANDNSDDEKKPVKRSAVTLETWNPNSADHACWFLYEHLHIPPSRYTKGGEDKNPALQGPSASYKGVLGHLKNPLVKAYVDRAEEEAVLRTLNSIKDKISAITGRLHPHWNSVGQAGTRFSSKLNVQNWDSTIKLLSRQVLGRVWLGADAAQIEYRVAALLAGIPELLELFNQDPFDEDAEPEKKFDPAYDAHSMVAAEVFGDVFTQGNLKLKKALRTLVKRVVYALFYGAFPEKIFTTLLEDRRLPSEFRAMLTLERIAQIHEGFSSRFPQWNRWAAQQVLKVRWEGHQVIPPFDRKRYWAMPEQVEETKIRNTPIQLAAGDIVNRMFLSMDDEIRARGLDAYFVVHGHDACEWDVAEADAAAVVELVNRHFDQWIEVGACRVHIYGQAKIGATLADV